MGLSLYRQKMNLSSRDAIGFYPKISLNSMRLLLVLIFVFVGCGWPEVRADDSSLSADDRPEPLPYHFPVPYSDLQIVDGSISPHRKYAATLRDSTNDGEPSKNYLIALSPFRVLLELPTDAVSLEGDHEGGLSVIWSKDNSAAIFTVEGKFGPDEIYAVTISADKVVQTTDLLASLRNVVLPDFRKAGAERFNDNFDFFLLDDDRQGWYFNSSNQLVMQCAFTNDPRLHADKPWGGHLTAVWDAKSGKLIKPNFTRSSGTN